MVMSSLMKRLVGFLHLERFIALYQIVLKLMPFIIQKDSTLEKEQKQPDRILHWY